MTTVFQLEIHWAEVHSVLWGELIIFCKKKFSVVFYMVRYVHKYDFSLIVNWTVTNGNQ
jgi:hypothetical protein